MMCPLLANLTEYRERCGAGRQNKENVQCLPANRHGGNLLLLSKFLPPLYITAAQLVKDLILPLLGDPCVVRVFHISQMCGWVALERLVDLLESLTNLHIQL